METKINSISMDSVGKIKFLINRIPTVVFRERRFDDRCVTSRNRLDERCISGNESKFNKKPKFFVVTKFLMSIERTELELITNVLQPHPRMGKEW